MTTLLPNPIATVLGDPPFSQQHPRRIAIWSFPFSFILFFIQSVCSRNALPFLGIIPLALSGVHAALFTYPSRRPRHLPLLWTPHTTFIVDTLLALTFLLCIVSTLFVITDYYFDIVDAILGAYCTVFLMVVGAIHILYAGYYALRLFNECVESKKQRAAHMRSQQEEHSDQKENRHEE